MFAATGLCFPPSRDSFLEAQQRYFSYRAMLVAIVLHNSFVLVFFFGGGGYRTIIARYVAKRGIARPLKSIARHGVSQR